MFYLDALPQQASRVLLFTTMLKLIGGQFLGFSSAGGVISPPRSDLGLESPFDC